MPRRARRPQAARTEILECVQQQCAACGQLMWNAYDNHHTVTGLKDVVHLRLKVRRCVNSDCARYHIPYRPEEEGHWALPDYEFGLDVIAQIGTWRYQEHRTVPEIHQRLVEDGVAISERSVTNQLARFDELVALSLWHSAPLQQRLAEQGRVISPWMDCSPMWGMRCCG